MEDADEGTDKVIGVDIGAEIAARDSALDGGDEGAVDQRARAFDEAHGAAGDGIHRGNDERFGGDVVDEEQHPGAERFERRQVGGEALLGGGKLFHFAAVDGFDQGVAGGKVAVERARADAGLAGDIVEARGGAVAGEDLLGNLKDALAVALGIGARLAGGWRWFLFRHMQLCGKVFATGDILRLSLDTETVSVLFGGDPDVNSDAIFMGSVLTAGGATMRVFVTGSTGFIGTELVKELIAAGHQVRGLTRSDAGVEQLKAAGAEVLRGDLQDLDSLRKGASGMDAVVNLAFNHDFSKFAQNGADEIKAIEALGSVLEPGKLLVVTSGIGITSGAPGQVRKETDPPVDSPAIPRRPEQAAQAVAAKGVHVAIVRLPQVHDTRKQGLVTWMIQIAREKGVSAYVGDGAMRWAAGPLKDVAHLYRLAVEKTGPGVTTYHAVEEEGVSLRDVAETIGKGLKVPVVSIPAEKAGEHFGTFGHFVTLDMPASSEWTRKTLGWKPSGTGLIEDLANMKY